ncbi:copper-binding protein [Acidovorax sp. RAC01]|uniref:copper-binding protein n=1 Tax=Acidovorax sp. RAC01 TaxID=1842533 RepID=UPI0008591B31|nr:copper-binding protein [Acidovorax sp. RAC01]AOG24934.1 copper binding periplasmic CusF family protein [Acidovorax sp. RAC01]
MKLPRFTSSMTVLTQHGRYTASARTAAAALVLAGLLGPAAVLAQTAPAAPPVAVPAAVPAAPAAATAPATSASDLSEGEVVRWDPRTSKVTLRHGPIKNLDMPPMIMVFVVKDTTNAAAITPGAKLRFRAEQQQGAYVLTRVEPAP